MPFVIQALDLRRRFFDADAALSRLEAALAPVTVGVMVFDEAAVLQHANPAARVILARRDGLSIDAVGRPHADQPSIEKALRAYVAQVGAGAQSRLINVPHKGPGKQSYVVRISPSPGVTGEGETGGFTTVISDIGRTIDDAAYLVGVVYGLSPEAARLVAALVGGDDLAAYAEHAGISINTAKYHLKTTFAVTGTRRQIDLVRLALALLRDLG